MIKVIDLHNLRNAEYIQFIKDILRIITLNNPAALLVMAQHTALTTLLAELEALFITDQGNPITAILLALDNRRDAAITGMGKVVDGYTSHYQPAKADAARQLVHNLGLYGSGISRLNYLAETTTISNIVVDWNAQAPLQAAVAELGLEDWLVELETANNEFGQQYIARTQEIAAMNPDTIRAKRQEASDMYYFTRSFLDFYYSSNNGIDPWGKCSNEINALIDQYNVLLAGREGQGEEEEPTPEPDPVPQQG